MNNRSLSDIIYVATKFNLDKLGQDFPQYKERERRLSSNVLGFDCFTDFQENKDDIEILGVIRNKRTRKYISSNYIDSDGTNIHGYKVALPKAEGNGIFGETVTNPVILNNNSGYTHTFYGIGNFCTIEEANNTAKYVKTKFARTLLSVLKVTQNVNAETWKYVPLQDFTDNSDIDWNVSIVDIDKQLYKKYGLTREEIDFVETHVKEMA